MFYVRRKLARMCLALDHSFTGLAIKLWKVRR